MGKWNRIELTKDEILDKVREFRTKDNAPNYLFHLCNKEFGNWTNATLAAGIRDNIGGKFRKNAATIVYYVDFGNYKKIGITQQKLKERLRKFPPHTIIDTFETDLEFALDIEREIKAKIVPVKLTDPKLEGQGKTECFYSQAESILDLLSSGN